MKRIILLFIVLVILVVVVLLYNTEGFVDAGRCGVGLPSCKDLRCMNGYCKSSDLPLFPKVSDLQML